MILPVALTRSVQLACRSYGARLVAVDSEYKNNFVKQLLGQQLGASEEAERPAEEAPTGSGTGGQGPEVWIGIKTRAQLSVPVRYANFVSSFRTFLG